MRDLYKSIVPIQDSFDQIIIKPSAENEYKISIDDFLSLFDEEREFEDMMKEIEEEMLEDEKYDSYVYDNNRFHIIDRYNNIDFEAKLSGNNYYFKDNT